MDRFCLLASAKAHIEKIRRFARAGVTQFNIYLMCGDEEDTLDKYKNEVRRRFKYSHIAEEKFSDVPPVRSRIVGGAPWQTMTLPNIGKS